MTNKTKTFGMQEGLRFSGEWNIACGMIQRWPARILYGRLQLAAGRSKELIDFVGWLMTRKGMTRAQAETYIRETDDAIREWEHNAMEAEKAAKRREKARQEGTVQAGGRTLA